MTYIKIILKKGTTRVTKSKIKYERMHNDYRVLKIGVYLKIMREIIKTIISKFEVYVKITKNIKEFRNILVFYFKTLNI